MIDILLLLAVFALGVVAYQLHALRRILDEGVRAWSAARDQRERDEAIRDAFPNLFYQLRPELRDWFSIHERNRAYYEQHKKYGDFESPHSEEESSWFDIFQRLLKNANDDQKRVLGIIASTTDTFLEEAAAKTVLKPAEVNFVAFQAWRDLLDEGGDALVLSIIGNHIEKDLNSKVEAYRRGASSDADVDH